MGDRLGDILPGHVQVHADVVDPRFLDGGVDLIVADDAASAGDVIVFHPLIVVAGERDDPFLESVDPLLRSHA